MKTKWTIEEIDVLRSYPTLSSQELTTLLIDKSVSQITYKRNSLGFQCPVKYLSRRIKCSIGDKNGFLELKRLSLEQENFGVFECNCGHDRCKKEVIYKLSEVFGKTGFTICGSQKLSSFEDYKEIKGIRWNRIVYAAKARNIEFNITVQEAWDLFIAQDRKCALTGWPIGFEYAAHKGKYKEKRSCTASLDRINPKFGYTKENCQWLLWEINHFKNKLDQETFIKYCKAVALYKG